MAPGVLQHATKAFFTTKESGRGTGLGLWMVKRTAAAHGGKVVIDTAVGKGTSLAATSPTFFQR